MKRGTRSLAVLGALALSAMGLVPAAWANEASQSGSAQSGETGPGLVTLNPASLRAVASSHSAQAWSRSVSASQDAEYGETTTWARWRSLTSEYPVEAIVRLRAPTKFREPSARVEGP